MAFTSQQLRAINEYGTNILVSAGAGSGKTAVLSERVFNHVANRGINIDELLVLTFTNAAAREMKRRIRDKLSKGLIGEQLKRQLTKLDSSFITTFDAYALSLVKKYHYLLNIDPNVNLIDDNVLKIKISEFLDEMMEEEYEKKDPSFIKLISDFTVKNDNEIRDYILKINSGLNLIYERTDYVSSYEEYNCKVSIF